MTTTLKIGQKALQQADNDLFTALRHPGQQGEVILAWLYSQLAQPSDFPPSEIILLAAEVLDDVHDSKITPAEDEATPAAADPQAWLQSWQCAQKSIAEAKARQPSARGQGKPRTPPRK